MNVTGQLKLTIPATISGYLRRAATAELERRECATKRIRVELDIGPLLSAAQRERGNHPGRFKAIPAGRQSGKTDLIEKLLLKCASSRNKRGQQALYVSTSINRAVETIWDEMVEMNRDMGLGGIPNHTRHSITYPAAAKLRLWGVENKAMADKIRGLKKVAFYCLDECQDWRDELLRYFFEKVVYPSLVAVGGEVIAAGTGGMPLGWWYEVATGARGRNGRSAGQGWDRFGPWTPMDNPFLPAGEAQKLIAKACEDRGCDLNDPSIQTEFFAAFVADLNRQIFHYDRERNGFSRGTWDTKAGFWKGGDLPSGEWSVVIASDAGSVDAAAYAVIGKCDSDPRLWVLETEAIKALGSSAQVALARTARERYGNRVVQTVMDPGGGGKGLIIDLNQEHLQGIEAAEKKNKAAACVIMRDGLRSGKLMVAYEESDFIADLAVPVWDPMAIGTVTKGHFPDRCDCALYGYRAATALFHGVKVEDPQAKLSPFEREKRRSSWK